MEQQASGVFGRALRVQFISKTASKPVGPGAAGKKKLDQVYEAFPRDKIEIIDD